MPRRDDGCPLEFVATALATSCFGARCSVSSAHVSTKCSGHQFERTTAGPASDMYLGYKTPGCSTLFDAC